MTPQFNLLRAPRVGSPYHECRSVGRHDVYISFMLPHNSYLILRVKKSLVPQFALLKVQTISEGEN